MKAFCIYVLVVSCVLSWYFLWFLIPHLRGKFLDLPNHRSSHSIPTPRGGGIAFVIASFVPVLIPIFLDKSSFFTVLPLLALPVVVVSLLDDRLCLPAAWRYFSHLITAFFILSSSPLVSSLSLSYSSAAVYLVVCCVLVISITSVMNFSNFMDGLDGLVAGCMVVNISALGIALDAPWPLWTLVGSLLGFLLWNWSPAKVFMGDVGSTFLGAVFAGLVLQATSWSAALGYLLVATPLLGDACLCVPRRLFAGQRVFQAHRLHLFQRLHQAGWSHARVSLTYVAATAVLAVAMLVGGLPWVLGLSVAELLIGFWLDQRVAVHFAVASNS